MVLVVAERGKGSPQTERSGAGGAVSRLAIDGAIWHVAEGGTEGTEEQCEPLQGAASGKSVTTHAAFLANVSRHFVSLEIEPMLEAVGRCSLGVLGDVCTVDRVSDVSPNSDSGSQDLARRLDGGSGRSGGHRARRGHVWTASARGSACRSECAATVSGCSASPGTTAPRTAPPISALAQELGERLGAGDSQRARAHGAWPPRSATGSA